MNPEIEEKESSLAAPESQDDTPSVEEDNQTDKTPAKSGGKLAVILVFLLSVAALAAAGYLYQLVDRLGQQVVANDQRIDESLQNIRSELTGNQQQLKQNLARMQEETLNLKRSVSQLYKQTESDRQSWSVDEINHLLQLATDQLELGRNIEGALTALTLADRRISETGDPALQEVRQQIARDIAQLQQVERIDLAGTLNRMQAIEQSIGQLPLLGQRTSMEGSSEPAAEKPDEAISVWQKISDDLSGLVKIRHIDQPVKPLLPPDQQYYLRENIKALLMSARISLMRSETAAYRENLNEAIQLLTQYFDTGIRSTQWTINELENLSSLDPAPALPDIRGSLESLRQTREGKE